MTRLRLHFVTALLALLGFLPRCSPQTYSASPSNSTTSQANPYDAQVTQLRSRFASATVPEQTALLARIYALRDCLDDAGQLTRFFAAISADSTVNPLLQQEAMRYVAFMDLHAGRLDAAQQAWSSLGLLRDWSVVGPFAAPPNQSIAAGVRSGIAYEDRGAKRSWRSLPSIGPRGTLDLAVLFPNVSSGTVFAAATVRSESSRSALLKFGADSPATVFVNGKQVFDASDSAFAFDQHAVAIDLNAGSNDIVFAFSKTLLASSAQRSWKFSARLASGPAEDLLVQAQHSVDEQSGSAEALDTLGQLQQLRGLAAAHDSLERSARLAPTTQRWLRVASACANATCTFDALNSAQSSRPDNAEVLVRLAQYYASREQSQKARDLLEKALALAPGDFVVRVQLAELFLAAGRNADGMRDLRGVEQQFPLVPWVQKKLAAHYDDLGFVDRALELDRSALARDFDDPQLRAGLSRIYARRQDVAKLRALYAEALRLDPADIHAMSALAQLDAGAGNLQAAEAGFRSALDLAPGDAVLREHLADILAGAGRRDQADAELDLAARSLPASQDIHDRIAVEPAAATSDPDSEYMVNASELALKTHRAAPTQDASAVELADVHVERVAENGLSSSRSQQVVYISTDAGARDYATRTISYSTGSQKLQVLHARVFKADGRLMEAEDLGDSAPGESASAMYYDTRSRTLRYPSLEKGDVVELDYRLLPSGTDNPYGDYFGQLLTFGSSLPRNLQRYVLIAPAGRALHITAERLPAARETRTAAEHIYQWEMRDLAALPSEPRGPAITEVAPYVHVSTFDSWNDLGRWYAQLIAPQFKLDAALRDVLAKLIAGKTNDADKITAIHHFVLHNTHYVALEFGIYSYKPYPVSQVYARRFGDCKDKASLMIALLRAAGIDAELALVRTRRLGDIAGDAASISVFNHAVAYLPKYDLWLDGTAEYAGSHELPIDDQGAQALTVSLDGSAQLRRIPVTLPMENYTHRQVRAQLEPDGRIEFTGSAYTRGEDAPGLRRDYEVPERQRASFRNRLAEVLPSVRLDSVEVDGAHDLESDVIVNFSGDLSNYAGKRVVPLTPSWMARSYVQTLAPLASRTQDLLLPAPWTTEEELHFLLPSGARIESLPQDINLDTPFGSAVVRYQRLSNEIVVKTSVQFRRLRVAPAEYAAFREFCSQIESAFRNQIKVGL